MNNTSSIIGIDLGTTNSAVAVWENGRVITIPNAEGQRTTPSVVAWRDQEVLVGQPAKRQQVTNPESTFSAVKRLIGRRFDDPFVQQTQTHASYKIVKGPQGQAQVKAGKSQKSPEEISAQVLRRMKEAAESYLGHPVSQAVITVPAYFDEAQRQATKDAGRIAGLEVMRIINEPTAAALAFGTNKSTESGKMIVYDLGGGTFDVSVIELAQVEGEQQFEVLATNGDTFLGGEDFDLRIIDYIAEEFLKEQGLDLRKDPLAKQRLKDAAESAKIELSSSEQTEINLPYITANKDGPKHLRLLLTRAKLENLVDDLVDKSLACCRKALDEARLNPADIKKVLLVGGQTRMPYVQKQVAALFGQEPSKEVNPDEAVAIGAAIQGSVLSGDKTDVLLLDVTPLSLGLATLGDEMTVLIPKNTTIPTRKTETFTTAADNQTQVSVEIYQGERASVKDNKHLGRMVLEIASAPRGTPHIEVSFDMDANGFLQVSAKEVTTGKSQQIKIQPRQGLTEADIQKLVKDAEINAAKDQAFKAELKTKNETESLLNEAEKMKSTLIGADAELLQKAIDELNAASAHPDKGVSARTALINLLRVLQTRTTSPDTSATTSQASTTQTKAENDVIDAEFTETN